MTKQNSLVDDPILAEIRRIREEFSRRFHGDIDAMAQEMRRLAEDAGRTGVNRPPRRPPGWTSPGGATDSHLAEVSEAAHS